MLGAAGGLGSLGVQFAIATGLRVVAIDSGADKRKMLEGYGVEAFVDFRDFPDDAGLIAEVKRLAGGRGAHVCVPYFPFSEEETLMWHCETGLCGVLGRRGGLQSRIALLASARHSGVRRAPSCTFRTSRTKADQE